MPDNLLISTGSGTTIATDQIDTAHYQKVKAMIGASDTASYLVFGQTNMTNSLPVVISSDQATVPVTAVLTSPIYAVGGTDMAATGTGIMFIGIQSGATTGRALALTVSGEAFCQISTGTLSVSAGNIAISNTPTVTVSTALAFTVGQVTTGTVSISAGNIAISNTPTVTVSTALSLAITTGTVNVVNTPVVTATISNNPLICTASGVTIASITTGSISIINTPVITATVSVLPVISGTGLLLGATTAIVGGFVQTAHASKFNAYAVSTTSGAAMILKTSGAHTLYVTDLLFSVDVPMNIDIRSATTVKATVYLATKGGFVFPTVTPFICETAQSLTFQPSASGSCAGYAAGYSVT